MAMTYATAGKKLEKAYIGLNSYSSRFRVNYFVQKAFNDMDRD
jgi:hypothetical protein